MVGYGCKITVCTRFSKLASLVEVGEGTYGEKRIPCILSTYHSVHRKQLVASLEPSVSFSYPSGDDTGDINWGILFLSSHHVETQAFISLWQFDYPRVGVPFAGCKCCNCCLKEKMVFW